MQLKRNSIMPPRIEMLPLIDIVFLLLVFFIYAMLSMAVHHGQPVDLPQSSSTQVEAQEAISITIQTIDQDILLTVDEDAVSLEALVKKLKKKKQEHQDGNGWDVQIFADKTVSYQQLFQVLDRVKLAGLTRISLQAEPALTTP